MNLIYALVLSVAPDAPEEAGSEPANVADELFSLSDQEAVVTGSRRQMRLAESPDSVWVIDRDTIVRSGAIGLADLLRTIPGVNIYETLTGDNQAAARGVYSGSYLPRMLFMIDGRAVNFDHLGTPEIDSLPVALADIERIEVVLGPATTLYGTNAYSGVVNLITRAPTADGNRVEAQVKGGVGFVGGGSPGASLALSGPKPLGSAYASYSQAFGRLRMRISLNGDYLTAAAPQGLAMRPEEEPTNAYKLGGNADVHYAGDSFDLRLQFQAAYKHAREQGIRSSPLQTLQDYAIHSLLSKRFENGGELTLQMWGRRNVIDHAANYGHGSYFQNDNFIWSGEIMAHYASPVIFKNRLLAGLQVRLFDVANGLILDRRSFQHTYGIFVEDEFRPIERLRLTAGVRLETRETRYYRPFEMFRASPRGAVVLVVATDHTLRAEVSTAYRNPTPQESFPSIAITNNTIPVSVDNKALQPESHVLGAVSYNGRVQKLGVRVEGYYGVLGGTIEAGPRDSDNLTAIPYIYRNVTKRDYLGGLARLSYDFAEGASLVAQYNYTQMFISPGRVNDAALRNHSAMIGGRYKWKALTASLYVHYQSGTTQPVLVANDATQFVTTTHRIVINPFISYAFGAKQDLEVFLSGTNVADIRFGGQSPMDVPFNYETERIGPRVFAGLQYRL